MSKFDPYEDIEPEHEETAEEEEEENPYAVPRVQSTRRKPVGSFAQSARGQEIGQARTILFVLGTLFVVGYGIMSAIAPMVTNTEIERAEKAGEIAPEQVEQSRIGLTAINYAIFGSSMALGVLFIIFGFIVKKFPAPITIASLALYILWILAAAIVNPFNLVSGLIVKIVVIVGLAKAIKAAFAYEQDKREGYA